MSKTLIINLKRFGDIYGSAHLITSIKAKNPKTQISLLVYKEFEKATRNLAGVDQVFTIDRQKILTLKKNPIFSDAMALNLFFEEIEPMRKTDWYQVINYSNEPTAAYLTSALTTQSVANKTGVYFSSSRLAQTSTDWDIILNDVLTSYSHTPIHFVDCYHQMTNTPHNNDQEALILDDKHTQTCVQNIQVLRESQSSPAAVAGLQLKASVQEKEIDLQTWKDFIRLSKENGYFIPVLLIAPIESERLYAQELNNSFDNSLIIIEADFTALASVLSSIDILITPDTVTKHVADLVRTPTLEISLGAAPLFKQGSYNPLSLILSPKVNERSFKEAKVKGNDYYKRINERVTALDIMNCAKVLIGLIQKPSLSSGLTLYRPQKDDLGIRYTAIAGDVEVTTEVSRLMSRYLLSKLFGFDRDFSILGETLTFDKKTISDWIETQKASITDVSKDLLGSLRSLNQVKESPKSNSVFTDSLNKSLSHCNSDNLIAIPSLIFRSKVESLETENFDSWVKETEALLYELKEQIQLVFQVLKELDQVLAQDWDNKEVTPARAAQRQEAPL